MSHLHHHLKEKNLQPVTLQKSCDSIERARRVLMEENVVACARLDGKLQWLRAAPQSPCRLKENAIISRCAIKEDVVKLATDQ
jgi:hypothetical protein